MLIQYHITVPEGYEHLYDLYGLGHNLWILDTSVFENVEKLIKSMHPYFGLVKIA